MALTASQVIAKKRRGVATPAAAPVAAGTEFTVGPSTGIAGLDSIAINGTIQTAAAAASATAGSVVKLTAGQTYSVTNITPRSGVDLDLNGSELKLADGANTSAVKTLDYDLLTGGDTTGGPRDFKIRNGYIDGNKANQTDATKPLLATYGRRMVVDDLVIRNAKGAGWRSEWATSSPFLAPNGFESFVGKVYFHNCDGEAIDWNGPHDTFIQSLFIVKCGVANSAIPAKFTDETGRSNGTNVEQVHVYGGNGYNFGLVAFTAGMKFNNIIVEGAQTAQVKVGTQVKIDSLHAYTGGIQTANAVGVQFGDSTHTGINGVTIKSAVVENCGGGAFDFTRMGDNNSVDADVTYFSGTDPSNALLGWVVAGGLGSNNGARNNVKIRVSGGASGGNPTFLPTTQTITQFVGPIKSFRALSTDTRDLFRVLAEDGSTDLFRVDNRGRLRQAGPSPAIAVGAQLGTAGNGAAVTIAGSDMAGKITITTASTGAVAGQLAAITFAGTFATDARVMLMPKDAASAALQVFTTSAATAFSVRTGLAPAASTTYTFDYIVIGV